MTYATN
jgi:hypothetical protein